MTFKSCVIAAVLTAGLGVSAVVAQEAPAKAPVTKPTTKQAPPKPRHAEDAVGEVNRNAKRHESFLAAIKKGGQHDLLFIGDSITDFWPGKGKDSWAKFAEYKPLDLGISGERTEDVLFRLNHGELEGYKPKVAVIMIGTNNIGHFKDEQPEWVAAGIAKIVKTVQEKQPDTKILLLGVFPRDTAASVNRKKVKEINEQIAKLDDGSKVKFLDIGPKFLDEKGELPADIMPDKLHPTPKGYDIWYDAMWPTLSEMLK
jgi:lysophospholipase L1-like esterase